MSKINFRPLIRILVSITIFKEIINSYTSYYIIIKILRIIKRKKKLAPSLEPKRGGEKIAFGNFRRG